MSRGGSPSRLTFASLATPTTSQGESGSRPRTSRPTASPSVQKRRAIASLTMTTGRVSGRSASLKLRPRTISMPAAAKNPGSTSTRSAMKASVVGRRASKPVDVEVDGSLAERVQVQVADGADRLDAGERPKSDREGAACRRAPRRGREPGSPAPGTSSGRSARGPKPGSTELRPLKAAEEQAGADEQHQRDRELRATTSALRHRS